MLIQHIRGRQALRKTVAAFKVIRIKSYVETCKSHLEISCQIELYMLRITEAVSEKVHGKYYIKVRTPLIGQFLLELSNA